MTQREKEISSFFRAPKYQDSIKNSERYGLAAEIRAPDDRPYVEIYRSQLMLISLALQILQLTIGSQLSGKRSHFNQLNGADPCDILIVVGLIVDRRDREAEPA